MTWSREFCDFVIELEKEGVFRRRVLIKGVRGCAPYSSSYSLSLDVLSSHLRTKLLGFAACLGNLRVRGELLLFRDMLKPPMEPSRIRHVFALIRAGIIETAGDPRAALYSPVSTTKKDYGFSLHADLFLSELLWLIFEDVPDDRSGASLLMPRSVLLRALRSNDEIPDRIARQILDLMAKKIVKDSFDRLYGLLHGERFRWHEAISRILNENATEISFGRGEGYLLNDRRWLHGRTASSQPITARRFHGLTF